MKGRPTSQTQLLSVHLLADRTAGGAIAKQFGRSKGNVSSIIITVCSISNYIAPAVCEHDVRELYRKKGWAFKPAGMAPVCPAVHPPPSLRLTFPPLLCRTRQCQREGFMESVKANRGEGCNMRGYLEVPKVGGNFHFAPGRSFQQAHSHVHDLMKFTLDEFNITHRINSLSFGRRYPVGGCYSVARGCMPL